MMENFSLYARLGLRITVMLLRAIISDEPLSEIDARMSELYDDPYSILIHFAERCEGACEFWNEHIAVLSRETKLHLSLRVYSFAIVNVRPETYEKLKVISDVALQGGRHGETTPTAPPRSSIR
jgi:hypothetical protein